MLKKSITILINRDSTPVFHTYLVSSAIDIISYFLSIVNRDAGILQISPETKNNGQGI